MKKEYKSRISLKTTRGSEVVRAGYQVPYNDPIACAPNALADPDVLSKNR